MNEQAKKIIGEIQTLSDELARLCEHPDEFVRVSDLQDNIHKVRKAFETQIEEDE